MLNAIFFYRISRWFYLHHFRFLSKFFQLLIFILYNSKITGESSIGKGSYFVCRGISIILVPGTAIGKNCTIGLRFTSVRNFPYKNVPQIGDNVWIGPNVIVTGPVIIENDVIISGGSFVNKSVPAGAIVAGAPAKIIGWRKDLSYDINQNPKYDESIKPFLKDERGKATDLK